MSPWWRTDKRPRGHVDPDLDIALESPEQRDAPPQTESLFDADAFAGDWSGRSQAADAEPGSSSAQERERAGRARLFARLFAGGGAAAEGDAGAVPEPEPLPAGIHAEYTSWPAAPEPDDTRSDTSLAAGLAETGEQTGAVVPAEAADNRVIDAETAGTGEDPDADLVDDVGGDSGSARGKHVRRRRSGRSRRAGASDREDVRASSGGDVTAVGPVPGAVMDAEASVTSAVGPDAHSASLERISALAAAAGRRVLAVLLIVAVLLGSLFGLALGVNAFARWNARRIAALNAAPASPAEDNLLVIGVSDGVAVGFTALKAERSSKRVLGIAIPDGAFMEVPGQGFERVGASFAGGADVSKDAVSNYLGVPFHTYVVMDGAAYQAMLRGQSVTGIMSNVRSTDLTAVQRSSLTEYFASVDTKHVWIAPLPVKPVAVGDQQYFEPQRAQVADLLLRWWGVQPGQEKATPRVIVYNGVGTPGLAGLASQQLIKAGLRVVDSGNADNFKHQTTLILVYHGTQADADAVRRAIGVGQILVQSAPQQLTDIIVIIGADYRPPTADTSTVPTEGVQ